MKVGPSQCRWKYCSEQRGFAPMCKISVYEDQEQEVVESLVGFACVKEKVDWKWGEEKKAEYHPLSKHPSSWKQDLAKGKRTNINQYRYYFQATARVLHSRFLAQESDPCPVAAVFYPHLSFSILAKSHHTSTLTF